MVLTDIITEFGAYYKNSGQNMDRIYRAAYGQTDTTQYMRPMVVDGTRFEASKTVMGQVLQPFHKNFTVAGSITFKPVVIDLYHHKLDMQEYPDDLEASWLGFLTGEGVERKDWPFVKWFMEQEVLPKFRRDYELNEIYKGVYAAPNGNAAGAAGTSMNGIGKIIADAITATTITPITTGAISTDPETFCTQVETFANGIVAVNEDYGNIPMNIHLSKTLERRFRQGYRKKYGVQTDFEGVTNKVIDTNFTVVGLSSMAGSGRMFCTTKDNFLDLIYKKARDGKFDLQADKRAINVLGDTWRGAGFAVLELVFCNEQV